MVSFMQALFYCLSIPHYGWCYLVFSCTSSWITGVIFIWCSIRTPWSADDWYEIKSWVKNLKRFGRYLSIHLLMRQTDRQLLYYVCGRFKTMTCKRCFCESAWGCHSRLRDVIGFCRLHQDYSGLCLHWIEEFVDHCINIRWVSANIPRPIESVCKVRDILISLHMYVYVVGRAGRVLIVSCFGQRRYTVYTRQP